jgi:hypothetical protein
MERRKNSRQRTLKSEKIVFNNRASVIDCTIRNLTNAGAMLLVASTVGIPDSLDLLIETRRPLQACRVTWRRKEALGVVFR